MGPPVAPTLSHWGWACTITPIFDPESICERPEMRGSFRELYVAGDARHDLALVR